MIFNVLPKHIIGRVFQNTPPQEIEKLKGCSEQELETFVLTKMLGLPPTEEEVDKLVLDIGLLGRKRDVLD